MLNKSYFTLYIHLEVFQVILENFVLFVLFFKQSFCFGLKEKKRIRLLTLLINCLISSRPFIILRYNICAAHPMLIIFWFNKKIAFLMLAALSVIAAKHFSFKFYSSRIFSKHFLIFSEV